MSKASRQPRKEDLAEYKIMSRNGAKALKYLQESTEIRRLGTRPTSGNIRRAVTVHMSGDKNSEIRIGICCRCGSEAGIVLGRGDEI